MRSLRQSIERLDGWYPNLFLEPHVVAAVAVLSEYSALSRQFQHPRRKRSPTGGPPRRGTSRFELEAIGGRQGRTVTGYDAAQAPHRIGGHRRGVGRGATSLGLGSLAGYQLRRSRGFSIAAPSLCSRNQWDEAANEFERRHREKIAQAMANPFGWDAYVVICLFSATGHRIRLSRHEYPEESNE